MPSINGFNSDHNGTNGTNGVHDTNGTNDTNGVNGTTSTLDAVIVGGGFGGCYLLHKLRKQGLRVKMVEALDGFGGVWRGNWYPGARVDSEAPYYLFSAPELVNSWEWTERYPGGPELRRYFQHVDKVWDLSKDTIFNTRVTGASFEDSKDLWRIDLSTGSALYSRWFLPCCGTSNKQNIPKWPGSSTFKGEMLHPAAWPRTEDPLAILRGKRVAVIGSGSSGLQVVQEGAKVATQLTQFIRSPIIAYPMRQRQISPDEVLQMRSVIPTLMQYVRSNHMGLPYKRDPRKTLEVDPEEREEFWKTAWKAGGFRFTAGGFSDLDKDKAANRATYDFWRRQVHQRLPDPEKRRILAPDEPPYLLNTKRLGIEQDYYDMISLPHSEVTDSPITSFDETGILTEDGKHREFDVVVVATGYDAITGSLLEMNIKGRNSLSLADKWSEGVRTNLGMTIESFPNMFFPYGPQAPTSLSGGTPFIEMQVEWICDAIAKATESGWHTIEATRKSEEEWRALTFSVAEGTLLNETASWWNGGNIPGKRREMLIFLGGMPLYFQKCWEALNNMHGLEHT